MIVESTKVENMHQSPAFAKPLLGAVPFHSFPYRWTLKDANFTKDKGKVFSCFACGGGSTMGYKLAGFDVLGCNEIDPKMIEAYKANHNPKYAFLESIQTFKLRTDLPDDLYKLDILDGSPPCSSFSMAGNREKDWGKEKKFREGQAEQILDNLFFDFIDLAKKLQPKVVIAENVKGLLLGNAKQYVRQIYREFDLAGYYCQHWLLDASKMGVPQKRERVFFIAIRKDLAEPFLYNADMFTVVPKLELNFKEPEIPFTEISQTDAQFDNPEWVDIWNKMKEGDSLEKFTGYGFNTVKIEKSKPLPTIAGTQRINSFKSAGLIHPTECRKLNNVEFCLGGSYPLDYDFSIGKGNANFTGYLIGMSVPPIMTAQIAKQVYEQWLSKL
jgi:DNA (cytosine-5)-methyltransferase 1